MVHGQLISGEVDLEAKIIQQAELKEKHRELDEQIATLHTATQCTAPELKQMKWKKLLLKDKIEGRRH